MRDRITIIESFKSYLGERNKSINYRLKYLAVLKYLSVLFLILVLLIIIKSLLPINLLKGKLEWNDSALIFLLSITYILHGPRYFYEAKLLRHLKTVKNEETKTSEKRELNEALQEIINNLNDIKSNWLFMGSVAFFMITSLIQLLSDNFEYWSYLKIPFLIFIILIIFGFLKNYSHLNKNIKEYEKQ